MKISDLAVDPDRQENGAWVDDIPDVQGLRLKVRGAWNSDWRRLYQRLYDAVPRKKKAGGRLDPDENDAILTKCLLNCCLLDWDGLEDKEGKPIPYSKEKAHEYLTDPGLRRFRESVAWAANIVADVNDGDEKDASGNLVRLSDGNAVVERKSKAG